jgi:NAD-dependent SIR2 family protein deacetylase
MTTEDDSIIDRAERVRHSLGKASDPRLVQATVDGPCPNTACDGRVIATLHGDTEAIRCDTCGTTYPIPA